jgi:selenocysteine-specific elongation factor
MNNIIIGTAGHIDHGKTSLIKALTGQDTDRLKEEKERGITIDLGFSYFELPDGKRAGIIDVPGHEKFLNNMLSGIVGMDMILFVVAGDEGVMPQTIEHLNILNLIGVKNGIIVITKKDLIDEEMEELVIEDIKDNFKNTFLENSPIVLVSSKNGEGIERLKIEIIDMYKYIPERDSTKSPRMPIDRVFSLKGIGTVVTGTLIEGKIVVNDELYSYPDEISCRVRNIQVHGEDVEIVYAGQRAAINITSSSKQEISRGCVLAGKNSLNSSSVVDVELINLKNSKRIIKNGSRLHFFSGTSENLVQVTFFDRKELLPGEVSIAQIRFEKNISFKYDDKFIVRFYSPLETIGGGRIIDPISRKRKLKDKKKYLETLSQISSDIQEVIFKYIEDKELYIEENELKKIFSISESILRNILCKLTEEYRIFSLSENDNKIYVSYSKYNKLKETITKELSKFHENYNLKFGINKETLLGKIGFNINANIYNKILYLMQSQSIIEIKKEFVFEYGFEPYLNEKQKKALAELQNTLEKDDKIIKKEELYSNEDFTDVLEYLFNLNEIELIGNEYIMTQKNINIYIDIISEYIKSNGSITASEGRDILNTSRKKTILFLEYMDIKKITKRNDDIRVLI